MDTALIDRAIKSALSQDWKEAIRINLELLTLDQNNVESLNRLAYAHLKSGNLTSAKTTYKKVLRIDKYNPIAHKNLKWLENLTKNDIHNDPTAFPTPTVFLEEPGKTKIVTLVYPASVKALCNLMTAQSAKLVVKKHSVEVRNGQGTYIGVLPDDISHRLRLFISAGNIYDVYIKNVEKNLVTVFIRELKRGKKFAHLPSFSLNYTPYKNTTVADLETQRNESPDEE